MKRSHLFTLSDFFSILLGLVFISGGLSSCADNFLENNEPSWLGESIYEQLKQGYIDSNDKSHTFTIFTRLIDDIGYKEVLSLTGSKTLFVADDAAFEAFFKTNNMGVKSYEGLTDAQKKLIVNSSMINNAYLIELMSNTEGPAEGQALRRYTALSYIDTVTFEKPDVLPHNVNWNFYTDKGIHLLKDDNPIPMVHFLQKQMTFKGITDEDFSVIFNGKTRQENDAYIFGNKVVARDITCKNGYINILDSVLIPAQNMAEVIRTKPEISLFSSLLERYSSPYYNEVATNEYKLLHPEFLDSIFSKRYFAERSNLGLPNLLDGKGVSQVGYLEFDPGWNAYFMSGANSSMQTDMAAMFVPTNDVMLDYFNNGAGKFILEKYGAIDNIPNDVLAKLIRNLMKPSFLGSLPHAFAEIVDDGKRPMGIKYVGKEGTGGVKKTYLANNGVIYVTDIVYPPASFAAVTAPILINDNTKIINKEISALSFDAYLLSMDSRYSLSVPLDIPLNSVENISYPAQGMYYIDPVAYAKKQPEIFRFNYKPAVKSIPASVIGVAYQYNKETGILGDSLRSLTATEIENRFQDILDYHIVVGDIESGKEYYQTKGGGTVKISKSNGNMKILGGGNLELNKFTPEVTHVYDQWHGGTGNGKTYLVNSPILPSYRSVYKVLSDSAQYPSFNLFFRMLNEAPAGTMFVKAGMDYNIKSFNTFHYTVYVPTNEALNGAIAKGLPTWDIINQITDPNVKDSLSNVLLNFLRYHIQDNSLYIDGTSGSVGYETSAYSAGGTKNYYKLYTKRTPDGLALYNQKDYSGTPVNVKTTGGLFNIMTRDYKFNTTDMEAARLIETSSWAVIHQIDNVLLYNDNILNSSKQLVSRSKVKRN